LSEGEGGGKEEDIPGFTTAFADDVTAVPVLKVFGTQGGGDGGGDGGSNGFAGEDVADAELAGPEGGEGWVFFFLCFGGEGGFFGGHADDEVMVWEEGRSGRRGRRCVVKELGSVCAVLWGWGRGGGGERGSDEEE